MPIDGVSQERGIGERIKEWWSKNPDVGERLEKLKKATSKTTEHIVDLIVVFLMQTLVMPLLLFWALCLAVKALMDQQPSIGAK